VSSFSRTAALLLSFVSLVLAACAPTATVTRPDVAAPDAAAEAYVLGPSDKIRVIVFGEPNLTGEFVVSGAGMLSYPLVGDVAAAGLTVSALQETLRTRLADGYLRDPRVTVEVLTYRPFYILGEVNKPGEYPYTNGLTIINAVATAGGFTYRANQKVVMVRGQGDEAERPVAVSPTEPVRPGDTIRVRERFF
jgi:protein involved in polysaccharide export with SLBB domain